MTSDELQFNLNDTSDGDWSATDGDGEYARCAKTALAAGEMQRVPIGIDTKGRLISAITTNLNCTT